MKRHNSEHFLKEDETTCKCIKNNDYFSVYPISSFNTKFPFYSKPNEIGHFSIDAKRSLSLNQSEIKYLKIFNNRKDINFDLRDGYKDFIKKPEDEKLDNLLRWIEQSNFGLRNPDINFICWRGLLTKIMCIPYEKNEALRFAVQRFNGLLYLCEFKTDENVLKKSKESDREKEMCYWGLRFENYMTFKSTVHDLTSDSVNANEEYGIVVTAKLEELNILMGAEVDCCRSENKNSYIELKTSRLIQNERQMYNFKKFKLIKWWAQSFLIGIDEIICGFRNDNGLVMNLESFQTNNIPKMVEGINDTWSASICFNFLLQVLKYIKKVVNSDWDKAVYVFDWCPHSSITFTLEDIHSSYSFLPNWYTEKFS